MVEIGGVPFDPITYQEVIQGIDYLIKRGVQSYITTPNPEMILDAQDNHEFKKVLQEADISIPDGIGVLWAAHYLDKKLPENKFFRWVQLFWSLKRIFLWPSSIRNILPERVSGSDVFLDVVEASEETGWRIFLLGAEEGVAEHARGRLLQHYPEANIVGTYAGSPDEADLPMIKEAVNRTKPDILFVAYGHPKQELWINQYLSEFPTVSVAIGVGGTFDFIAGKTRRAPSWMRHIGLEWLWRLIIQPSRIRRIWKATVTFVRFIMKEKNFSK